MTFPLRGADGRFRPFLTRIQPVRAPDGKVARWFGVNTDVSRQVAANEALQAAQTTLQSVNDDLKLANEEIQRFAYIVSHDLRSPLINVLGFTSELDDLRVDLGTFLREVEAKAPELATADRRQAIETELPEALGFIRASTQKMDRLINAILKDVPRRQAPVDAIEPIDVAALVEAQGKSLAQQLAARAGRAQGRRKPSVARRRSGRHRTGLRQHSSRTPSNTCPATDPAAYVVSGAKEGSVLRYQIADNGRGIEAKDMERIFDLFRRAGEQDTTGEGIGLAYVRNLVRRLGGSVTCAVGLRRRFDLFPDVAWDDEKLTGQTPG